LFLKVSVRRIKTPKYQNLKQAYFRYNRQFMRRQEITIYNDGSARGNTGPGGYGTILMYGDKIKELSHGYRKTTNNRMELMAVIAVLKQLKRTDIPVTVYSDSQYVVNAVEKGWLKNWIATDFKGDKKNPDLWKRFYHLAAPFKLN